MHDFAYKSGKVVFFCAGNHPKDITNTALLIGSFLILYHGLDADEVVEKFEPLSPHFAEYDDGLDVADCWSALHHVNQHCKWLKLESKYTLPLQCTDDCQAEPYTIDMAEYVHYDSPLNGTLHVLVPDKLLVLNCPEDLPGGAPWSDACGVRRFGAAHYAGILADFGVAVLVRGGARACAYDASPLAAGGIEVEDLPILSPGGVPTLAEIDRFLARARHAPGAVAVHGGPDGGLGAAATLIAAHLIREHRFRAQDAIAWVRMIHPAALPAPHQRFRRAAEAGVRAAPHRSAPALAALAAGAPGAAAAAGGAAVVDALAATLSRSVSAPRIPLLDGFGIDAPPGWPGPAAAPRRPPDAGPAAGQAPSA